MLDENLGGIWNSSSFTILMPAVFVVSEKLMAKFPLPNMFFFSVFLSTVKYFQE